MLTARKGTRSASRTARTARRSPSDRERRREVIDDGFGGGRRGMDRLRRRRRRGACADRERGKIADQRRRSAVVLIALRRVAQHYARRCAQVALGERASVCHLACRGRAWQVAFALPVSRQQRIGLRRRRPALRAQARDPQRVERQALRFQQAENLDRCFRPLGLEDGLRRKLAQRRGFVPRGASAARPPVRRSRPAVCSTQCAPDTRHWTAAHRPASSARRASRARLRSSRAATKLAGSRAATLAFRQRLASASSTRPKAGGRVPQRDLAPALIEAQLTSSEARRVHIARAPSR